MKDKFIKFLVGCVIAVVAGGIIGITTIIYHSFTLPKISSLSEYNPPVPSQILSKNGTVLAEIGKEKRDVATFDEIPNIIVDAFLSAEDDNFYNHKGVDYLGVLRALIANIKAGRVVQGGSTITQQVAKSLLLSSERSISRKIKDFLLAIKIEKKLSKQDILFLYLNQIYFGGGYYGVKSAFRGYFDKELSETTIAEAAMIAGLLVAPGKYSPYINPQYAKNRQNYVLKRMRDTNKITEEQYLIAKEEKIKFRLRKKFPFKAGHFTDWVRQRVIKIVGEKNFLKDGYKVVTTLDYELQQIAESEVYKGSRAIDKRQGYKGPLKNISDEELSKIVRDFRKETYKNKSLFFILTEDYNRKYEIEYTEDEFEKIEEKKLKWKEKYKDTRFVSGNIKTDPLLNLIDEKKNYKATVTRVDDFARMIYVSIGDLVGIIPYEKFRWAKKRIISENYKFAPYVTKPSTILKKGDVILVQVLKKSVTAWRYLHKPFQERFSKAKEVKSFKQERFILCFLEQDPEVEGALVSLDSKTGAIVSLVGGKNFLQSQFNRVIQSQRQPGSSFKPFIYAVALENKFSPSSVIVDSPESLGSADANLNWKPRNYDGKFRGPMTFRNSLELSRNVPTIKIAKEVGVKKILQFSERIALNAKLDKDLSVALGSFGISLLDIVSSYAIFPNGGKILDPYSIISITDRYGNLYVIDETERIKKITAAEQEKEALAESLIEAPLSETDDNKKEEELNPFFETLIGEQVYDSRLAYLMTNILRGVVLHGTGRSAKEVSTFLGGKTGTTSSYVDAWFIGFSSKLVTGVWTGMDDNSTMGWGESGSKSALPIWKEFMRSGVDKYGEHDFNAPSGIINVMINKDTGKLTKASDPKAFMEAYVEGTEPGNVSDDGKENVVEDKIGTIMADDDYYNNQ
jgi:penicillin-binding protein 1A